MLFDEVKGYSTRAMALSKFEEALLAGADEQDRDFLRRQSCVVALPNGRFVVHVVASGGNFHKANYLLFVKQAVCVSN